MESDDQSGNSMEDAVIELLTLTYEIDKYGTKRYHNKEGQIHRIHGPAIICIDGGLGWYKNNICNGYLSVRPNKVLTYIPRENVSIYSSYPPFAETTHFGFIKFLTNLGFKNVEKYL